MEEQIEKFITESDVSLYLLSKETPSGRWLDWQEYDRGPGIFSIPEDRLLGVRGQAMNNDSLKQLVQELKDVHSLRYLYLAENRGISDKGILNLQFLPQLEYLNISACDITSDGLAFLLLLPKLSFLDLSYCNRISGKAAQYIQKLPRLTFLNLQGVVKIKTSDLKKFEKKNLEIQRY